MSTFAIVLIVLAVVFGLLMLGGLAAARRRDRAGEPALRERIAAANEALAAAHAQDKGWARETLEGAARAVFAEQQPGAAIDELHLIQVIDRPGTDADVAVFRVVSGGRDHSVTLGRRQGEWVAAA